MKLSLKPSITAFALALVAGTANAGERQNATISLSDNPQTRKIEQDWGFADAVVTGDTIYLSGVVAGLRPGETGLQVAYDRAFQRIGKILERSGASWDDVVEMTSFHTDLKTQMPAIVAVKSRCVRTPPPACTAIQVVRLIPDAGITEIRIVAKLPKRRYRFTVAMPRSW